ncbi:hypothetical protein CKALI_02510 [Corynebacterium kalinowskii]|uniref:Uncharacterized protein n=1 Tax=Corynebacterium kalinowskii TaxID=2675216 RepID=A0A6B8VNM7_9CORY|nr:hypothetical protein [Corynebacterium kalinowskii]QGU01391.1 hypothetical protein CKALI_02510 [Corynebacterium kalinowskii]
MTNPYPHTPGVVPHPAPVPQQPRPFQRAIDAVSQHMGTVVGATLSWAVLFALLAASYVACLYYFDKVAQLPQDDLNRVGLVVVPAFAAVFLSIMALFVAVSHARAVDFYSGRRPTYRSYFSLRGAGSPLLAYVLSKTLVFFPIGIFVAAMARQQATGGGEELTPGLLAICLFILVWCPVVGYLTMFATAAATEVGPMHAIIRSAKLTTRYPGGAWATIGVIFLVRLLENFTMNLSSLVTAPYLSFAMVSKYQELRSRELPPQNFAGGGAGYPVY